MSLPCSWGKRCLWLCCARGLFTQQSLEHLARTRRRCGLWGHSNEAEKSLPRDVCTLVGTRHHKTRAESGSRAQGGTPHPQLPEHQGVTEVRDPGWDRAGGQAGWVQPAGAQFAVGGG